MEKENILTEKYRLLHSEKYGKLGFDYLDIYEVNKTHFALRRNSIDETIFSQIMLKECYHPNLWFNRNLRESFSFVNVNCILDIGANIGVASCYFSALYPKAQIYSFEVDSDNYDLLVRNTAEYKNVNIYQKAIWDNCNGVYVTNRNSIYGHSGKPNPAKYIVGEQAIESEKLIESIRISDFMVEMEISTIDILKMDIQGAEIEAFEDAYLWLPHVRLLFIEIHDIFRNGCSRTVFAELVKYGNFRLIGSPNHEILAFLREGEI